MKALRYTLQLVVFLFFAGYFLTLVTGGDLRFNQIMALVLSDPDQHAHHTTSLKPSPIERLAALSR